MFAGSILTGRFGQFPRRHHSQCVHTQRIAVLPLAFLLGLGPACRCTHIVSELFKKRRHASPVWHLLPTSCCLHRRRKCESQFNCTLSLLDFCPAHRGAQSSSANKIHKLIGQAYWHQGPYCGRLTAISCTGSDLRFGNGREWSERVSLSLQTRSRMGSDFHIEKKYEAITDGTPANPAYKATEISPLQTGLETYCICEVSRFT